MGKKFKHIKKKIKIAHQDNNQSNKKNNRGINQLMWTMKINQKISIYNKYICLKINSQ